MGCHEGICMLRCGSDNECASNERCNKGQCMLTCRVDNDCFLGHVCLNKMCLVGCREQTDCPSSQSCIANQCVDPCSVATCGPNAQCQALDRQVRFTHWQHYFCNYLVTFDNLATPGNNQHISFQAFCSCEKGFIPNPNPAVSCIPEPIRCQTNKQCPEENFQVRDLVHRC